MAKRRKNAFGYQLTNIKRRKTRKKQVLINWLDLPQDIMILIFMKLGPIEIIFNAQHVCSSWRKLSYQPQLFRTINVQRPELYYLSSKSISNTKFEMFFKEALHRSCGQLVEVSCEAFLDQPLLNYVVVQPNSLKTLRLGMHVSLCLVQFILNLKRLLVLEKLALFCAWYTENLLEEISLSCPKLRHLRLDYRRTFCSELDCDKHAFVIAKSMAHLSSLQLIGSLMSNKGLEAILDGCPKLEYLDLRCCFNITLEGDLLSKDCLGRIRKVKLPNEKIGDWYNITTSGAPVSYDEYGMVMC